MAQHVGTNHAATTHNNHVPEDLLQALDMFQKCEGSVLGATAAAGFLKASKKKNALFDAVSGFVAEIGDEAGGLEAGGGGL